MGWLRGLLIGRIRVFSGLWSGGFINRIGVVRKILKEWGMSEVAALCSGVVLGYAALTQPTGKRVRVFVGWVSAA